MSLIHNLQTALGVAFVVTVASAAGVTAQTQDVADSSATTTAKAVVTSNLKKAEAANSSIATLDNIKSDKTSEVSRDPDNSKKVAVADAPTAPGKMASETPDASPQTPTTDKWQFQVTPYFWMAGLHGTTGTTNRTTELDESFSDVFHVLNFAFMGVFEAHKDKLSVLTDLEYVNLEDDRATPGPLFSAVNAKVKTFIFDPEVGYRVYEDPDKGSFVDVVGGARIWHISTDFTFSPGILSGTEVNASRTWVDGVGGLRGKAALTDKVFLTGKFDLGGGGSKFTYQLFGGAGYSITPKIALIFGYRVLDVNYDRNNFVYDTNQRGPIVGVGFKF